VQTGAVCGFASGFFHRGLPSFTPRAFNAASAAFLRRLIVRLVFGESDHDMHRQAIGVRHVSA
jgi:hypothetical protein